MKFNKSIFPFFLILVTFLISSCAGVKQVTYFQKLDNTNDSLPQNQLKGVHCARIKPLDLLSITVVTTQPATSQIYNLVVPQITDNVPVSLSSMPTLQTYLVDENGFIDFPVLGKLLVKGITRNELELLLQNKLASAFNKEHPIVTIRITNFSVNIVGEVLKPGKYITGNERLTIFEGLALAGDMTIYGRRDNVKVLRENADGTKKYMTVDLTDENIIYSPAYYLEQNDVVYVAPNKSKANSSNFGAAESFGISALSILFSLSSLVITIIK
ncbi:MAG: polysaccharide biosynthesis/export family protein [Paludibacter sp.]|nr:polysaccharide biosynthesis/export family protein [Paludibacter sp.]